MHRSIKPRVIGVWLVLFAILFVNTTWAARPVSIVDQQVKSLGVFTDDYSGDIASDGSRVHIVWQTRAGFFHTTNIPGSGLWKKPTRLAIPPAKVLPGKPRVVISDGRILLFYGTYLERWFKDVSKNGQWRSLPSILQGADPVFSLGDVATSPEGVVLAGLGPKDRLDVFLGSPGGDYFFRKMIWSLPPGSGWSSQTRPSLAVDGRNIHVLWSAQRMWQDGRYLRNTSYLFHFYSPDFGRKWRKEEISIGGRGQGRNITELKILQGRGRWWIIYAGFQGLYAQSTSASFGDWEAPINLTPKAPATAVVTGVSGKPPLVLWVDPRFRGQEWWGHIPFHQVAQPNTSPAWKNNDVFVIDLDHVKGSNVVENRITEHLSHTNPYLNDKSSLRVLVAGGYLYALRKGCSKVGYTLEQFGAKPELFVHVIPLEEIK